MIQNQFDLDIIGATLLLFTQDSEKASGLDFLHTLTYLG